MSEEAHRPLTPEQRRYWLRNCQGFRVDGPGGKVGVVEDVLFGSDAAEPAALVVRAGMLGTRVEVVSIEDVADVDPQRTRIWLAPH